MTVSTDLNPLAGDDQDGAARSSAFQVHLDVFEGPFDLLLGADLQAQAGHHRGRPLPGHRRVHRVHPAALRRLGPGPGQLLPGRRGHPARPEGRPAAAVGRGRGRGGPRPAGGQGPAVRPAAAVPRVQGGRGRSSRAGWPRQARRFPRRVPLEPRFADLLPEVLLGLGPAEFARLAALRARAQAAAAGRHRAHPRPARSASGSRPRIIAALLRELRPGHLPAADRRRRGHATRWWPGSWRCSSCTARRRSSFEQVDAAGRALRDLDRARDRRPATLDRRRGGRRRYADDEAKDADVRRGADARPGRCEPAWRRSCWSSTSRCRGGARPGARAPAGRGRATRCATWPRPTPPQGRGFDLREVAGGWRFYTREECAAAGGAVRPRRPAGPADPGGAGDAGRGRLPAAGQPGAGLGGARRQLRRRDAHADPARAWSRRRARTTRPARSCTGRPSYFLERLGLASLDELPELAPFLPENIEDIEDENARP